MPTNDESLLPYLEWEFLTKPIIMTRVNEDPNLPKGEKRIIVAREEDYSLKVVLEFNDMAFAFPNSSSETPAGTRIKLFDITGSDYSAAQKFTLENCHVYAAKTSIDDDKHMAFMEAKIYSSGFKTRTSKEQEINRLTEWCLNGPLTPVFEHNTIRKLDKKYTKERFESSDNKLEEITINRSPQRYSMDYLLVKTDTYKFVIEKVPEQMGPNWSSNLGIEYRSEWGKIPNSVEREEVLEILSFVFGRQLLPIGYTAYDKEENIVESYAKDPWGNRPKSYYLKGDHQPIKIDVWHRGRAEKIIDQLLPKYQAICETLNLKEALWNYWVSREMPLGTNLAILSAAVESIIYGYFKNKSRSDVYLKKKDFDDLLLTELKSIQQKLEKVPQGEKILKKIQTAYEAGITNKYRLFFENIKLPISEKEWEAIDERHIFVHGRVLLDDIDWEKVSKHVRTYELLFTKIILKLLDYSDTFIDYTTIGWPEVPFI